MRKTSLALWGGCLLAAIGLVLVVGAYVFEGRSLWIGGAVLLGFGLGCTSWAAEQLLRRHNRPQNVPRPNLVESRTVARPSMDPIRGII